MGVVILGTALALFLAPVLCCQPCQAPKGSALWQITSLLHTHPASSLAGTVQLKQQQILLQAWHVVPLLHCPARDPSSLAVLLCCLQTDTMLC